MIKVIDFAPNHGGMLASKIPCGVTFTGRVGSYNARLFLKAGERCVFALDRYDQYWEPPQTSKTSDWGLIIDDYREVNIEVKII
jgi:hypothetical protein